MASERAREVAEQFVRQWREDGWPFPIIDRFADALDRYAQEREAAARREWLQEANAALCGGLSSSANLYSMIEMHDRVLDAAAYQRGAEAMRQAVYQITMTACASQFHALGIGHEPCCHVADVAAAVAALPAPSDPPPTPTAR